jgi:predicted MPP superfamily phosphohydrolase
MIFSLVLLRDLAFLAGALVSAVSRPEWLANVLGFGALYSERSSACLLALSFACFGLGYREGNRLPRVRSVDVPIDGLPQEWNGFRIAQISDLHAGHGIRRDFIQGVVDTVNGLGPDIVALTGDMVDGRPEDLRADLEPLRELAARDGVFYVTGNHEYYWGATDWIAEMKRLGAVPLLNTHTILARGDRKLVVAGVPDFTARHFPGGTPSDPKAALAGAPSGAVRLLLAHQPKTAPAAAEAGFDLQLSGHTHGGQFIPWTFIIRFFHPFWRGLGRCRKMWIYVSRGTGFWGPPLRLGAPSEITLLRLVRPGS